jgi:hypothetical protein
VLVKTVDEKDESEELLPKANGRPTGTQDILNKVAREKRERKATKSDNAEIPEYLWEEHLLQDGVTPWVVTNRGKLRRAISLMRSRMLCWWKERVLASFLGWTRQQYPKLKEAAKKWAGCVEWVHGKYRWRADDDVPGKGNYKAW